MRMMNWEDKNKLLNSRSRNKKVNPVVENKMNKRGSTK